MGILRVFVEWNHRCTNHMASALKLISKVIQLYARLHRNLIVLQLSGHNNSSSTHHPTYTHAPTHCNIDGLVWRTEWEVGCGIFIMIYMLFVSGLKTFQCRFTRSPFLFAHLSLMVYLATIYLISVISLFKKSKPTKVNKDYLNKLVSFRGFNNNKLSNCLKNTFSWRWLISTCVRRIAHLRLFQSKQ